VVPVSALATMPGLAAASRQAQGILSDLASPAPPAR
jgi:hypothetical protein